jgi:hypothetical protein
MKTSEVENICDVVFNKGKSFVLGLPLFTFRGHYVIYITELIDFRIVTNAIRVFFKQILLFLNYAAFVVLAALATINGHFILDVAIFFPEFIRSHIAYQSTSAFRAFRFDLVSLLCHVLPPLRCFFLLFQSLGHFFQDAPF